MISTDLCPLCNAKLEMSIQETYFPNFVVFEYFCSKNPIIKLDTKNQEIAIYHYINKIYQDICITFITILPYTIKNSGDKTSIYYHESNDTSSKLVLETSKIDFNYSDENKFLEKIKKIIILS